MLRSHGDLACNIDDKINLLLDNSSTGTIFAQHASTAPLEVSQVGYHFWKINL